MAEFAIEKLEDILDDIKKLHQEQWDERGGHPTGLMFNPDYEKFNHFNDIGYFVIFTARIEGELIGHLSLYITQSMHTQTKLATEDTLFITKSRRGGKVACGLMTFTEEKLKEMGVMEWYSNVTIDAKVLRLMEYLGHKHVSHGMCKFL